MIAPFFVHELHGSHDASRTLGGQLDHRKRTLPQCLSDLVKLGAAGVAFLLATVVAKKTQTLCRRRPPVNLRCCQAAGRHRCTTTKQRGATPQHIREHITRCTPRAAPSLAPRRVDDGSRLCANQHSDTARPLACGLRATKRREYNASFQFFVFSSVACLSLNATDPKQKGGSQAFQSLRPLQHSRECTTHSARLHLRDGNSQLLLLLIRRRDAAPISWSRPACGCAAALPRCWCRRALCAHGSDALSLVHSSSHRGAPWKERRHLDERIASMGQWQDC